MHWAHPEHWVWMWMVPVVGALLVWAGQRRRRLLARFGDGALVQRLADSVDGAVRWAQIALVVVALALMVIALAGPQWGFHWQEVKHRGVDIVIALDVSKSMLAQDVKPNRLQRAKLAIQELIPLLRGDRLGLVAFAGTSFLNCPLTVDYNGFALMLEDISTETIPRGGTNLTDAIRTGVKALHASAEGSRALVLITDGESHEGDPLAAAKDAAANGVKIFCIGIGTAEGELIPVTDDEGQATFVKDREGRTVKSRLDEETLQKIAIETGGSYVRATATSLGLELLYRERIAKLDPQTRESTLQKRFEQRFQWPLALALLVLWVEPLLSDRRRVTTS